MPIAHYLLNVQEANTGPDLTRYALVCFALLLGILGVAYLFKRFLADSLRRKAAQRSLRVVDVLPLGGKQKLVVVSCYDRSFLLGLGEKEVSSIAELDVEGAAPATEEPVPFRDTLASAVREEVPIERPSDHPNDHANRGREAPWDDGQGVLA